MAGERQQRLSCLRPSKRRPARSWDQWGSPGRGPALVTDILACGPLQAKPISRAGHGRVHLDLAPTDQGRDEEIAPVLDQWFKRFSTFTDDELSASVPVRRVVRGIWAT